MRQGCKRRPTYLYCALIAAILLLVATKSSPLFPLNDWVDVNIYFTIGKGLFRGYVPYLDLYDQKGPTVYLLYGLASLVSGKTFFGVYLLETLSLSLFLYVSYRLIALLAPKCDALPFVPVLGALLLSSLAFSHGGSLEELCLPVFAYGLYSAVRYYRITYPAPPDMRMVFVNGLLAGLLLTAKFTLTAFYLAWMAVLFFAQCRQKRFWRGIACCIVFLIGMATPLAAWCFYFALAGALPEMWYYYFVSNITGYSALESATPLAALVAIGRSTIAACVRNWPYMLPAALGLLYFVCTRNADVRPVERINVWALAALLACGMYMGGQSYRYYAVVFAAFAPLGFAAVANWLSRALPERMQQVIWTRALPALLTVAGVGACLLFGSNTYLLGTAKADTPQYRFAADMERRKTGEQVTLLCRAFPDSGFYFAADVIPDCRYFTSNNVMLPEVAAEQVRRVEAGVPEFVVMRDRDDPPGARYTRIDTASLPYEQYVCTYYLYQRIPEKE